MNFQVRGGGMEVFVVFSFLVGMAVSIFWMVVGWRAMRAHERISDACDGWLRIRREERIIAIRNQSGVPAAPMPSAEDTFTPLKDAPPEFPWTKEV